MPTTINKDGEKWLATILAPGNPDAGPGMLRESYVEYFLICHDLNFSKQVIFDKDVGSLGYPADLVEHAGDQVRLASPTDILGDYRFITIQDFKLDGKDLAAHHAKVQLQGFYKKFDDLEVLLPSGLAVAAAREYGSNSGVPLLTDDAARGIRKLFLEWGQSDASTRLSRHRRRSCRHVYRRKSLCVEKRRMPDGRGRPTQPN
jgi:hypothetical protein